MGSVNLIMKRVNVSLMKRNSNSIDEEAARGPHELQLSSSLKTKKFKRT